MQRIGYLRNLLRMAKNIFENATEISKENCMNQNNKNKHFNDIMILNQNTLGWNMTYEH